MPAVAQPIVLAEYSSIMENTTQFSLDALKAPFFLRCAALFVDYIVVLLVPVLWLLMSTFFGDGPGHVTISNTVWALCVIVWLIDFIGLPLFRGQTLGKMIVGISIVKRDGRPARLGSIVLRNLVGYLLTVITLGIGFFIAAVNGTGRALHDYIAGTIVVRARKQLS